MSSIGSERGTRELIKRIVKLGYSRSEAEKIVMKMGEEERLQGLIDMAFLRSFARSILTDPDAG